MPSRPVPAAAVVAGVSPPDCAGAVVGVVVLPPQPANRPITITADRSRARIFFIYFSSL